MSRNKTKANIQAVKINSSSAPVKPAAPVEAAKSGKKPWFPSKKSFR
jgi:hypothetical protein